MTIGTRIKNRRKELGLSADELAARLGKDRSTVYRYEKGDIENIPIDLLDPIAKALNTTQQYLLGLDVQSQIDDALHKLKELEFAYDRANDEEKEELALSIDIVRESYEDLIFMQSLEQHQVKPTTMQDDGLREDVKHFAAFLENCSEEETKALFAMSQAFLANLRAGSFAPPEEDSKKTR